MNIIKAKNGNVLSKIMLVIGVILLITGNIIGIGYGLYLWGGTGMAFGLAAWTAFKLWASIMSSGFVLFLIGIVS